MPKINKLILIIIIIINLELHKKVSNGWPEDANEKDSNMRRCEYT